MNEVVERVARALHSTAGNSGEESSEYVLDGTFDLAVLARAAIEAHTQALKEAGYVIVPVEPTDKMVNGAWHRLLKAQAMWAKFETSGRPELIWKAMMDAALKERE